LKLAEVLVGYAGEKEKLGAAMREFEAEMFEHAEQLAQKAWANKQSHSSANGGEESARKLKGMRQRDDRRSLLRYSFRRAS